MKTRRILSVLAIASVFTALALPASAAFERCWWTCNRGNPGPNYLCSCFLSGVGYITTTCGAWETSGCGLAFASTLPFEDDLDPLLIPAEDFRMTEADQSRGCSEPMPEVVRNDPVAESVAATAP